MLQCFGSSVVRVDGAAVARLFPVAATAALGHVDDGHDEAGNRHKDAEAHQQEGADVASGEYRLLPQSHHTCCWDYIGQRRRCQHALQLWDAMV